MVLRHYSEMVLWGDCVLGIFEHGHPFFYSVLFDVDIDPNEILITHQKPLSHTDDRAPQRLSQSGTLLCNGAIDAQRFPVSSFTRSK